jgi:hypothetical protein
VTVIEQFEAALLPHLNEARARIASEYPALDFRVWSSSTGALTEYQGYDVGIECLFSDAGPDEANCVAISVGIWHITTEAQLLEAGVNWCQGTHPDVSAELIAQPVAFSEEALANVVAELPVLLGVFDAALRAWISRKAGA